MTELELRVFLSGCYKEELVDKLVEVFGVLEDQAQQIEQMKRCGNCKYLETMYAWGENYCLYHATKRLLCRYPYQLAGCKHWEFDQS